MRYLTILSTTIILATLLSLQTAVADTSAHWLSVSLDNDLFTGSDDGYTNGLFISSFKLNSEALTSEAKLPWYLRLQGRMANAVTADSWVEVQNLSQVMVTPTDIEAAPPDTNDLPYAGFLFWQGGIAAIHESHTTYISMLIGTVGPAALGEQSQKTIHRATGSMIPQGWDYQLENELLLGLSASRFKQKQLAPIGSIETDVVSGVYGNLGNYRSGLGGAAFLRIGKLLKESHGVFAMFTGREVNPVAQQQGWFGFLGATAYYELNNMIFQGNSSSNNTTSLEWDKHFGGVTAGFAFSKQKWAFSFNISDMGTLGDKYYGRQRYGSISVLHKLF